MYVQRNILQIINDQVQRKNMIMEKIYTKKVIVLRQVVKNKAIEKLADHLHTAIIPYNKTIQFLIFHLNHQEITQLKDKDNGKNKDKES